MTYAAAIKLPVVRAAADESNHADGWLGSVRRWHSQRLAIRELNRLPDHLLQDIGIDRTQIRDVVRGIV